MAHDRSRRFMDAFIGIEQELREIAKTRHHKPFYTLVNMSAKRSAMVHDISDELKEYADLRNVIVHERRNNEPIAEPHEEIVQRLEHILKLLRTPPEVGGTFLGKVVTCSSTDLVAKAASAMYENTFSKMPVYDGDVFQGLLTAEGITHWLGDRLKNDTCSLAEATVDSVLGYSPNGNSFAFIARDCPVFKVIDLFEEASHQGHRLQAILITEHGKRNQKPIGIITVFDLPQVYSLIDG